MKPHLIVYASALIFVSGLAVASAPTLVASPDPQPLVQRAAASAGPEATGRDETTPRRPALLSQGDAR
jgi:hypothetical protein